LRKPGEKALIARLGLPVSRDTWDRGASELRGVESFRAEVRSEPDSEVSGVRCPVSVLPRGTFAQTSVFSGALSGATRTRGTTNVACALLQATSMLSSANAIVLVDARADFRCLVAETIRSRGLSPFQATTVQEARDLLVTLRHAQTPVSHLVVDLDLPDGPGEVVLDAAKVAFPRSRVLTFADNLNAQRACALVGRSTHLPRAGLTPEALLDVLLRQEDRSIEAFAAVLALSRREFAVLLCMIEGLSIAEMAVRLRCKASTIKTYSQRIYNKARRGSQTELLGLLVLWLTSSELDMPSVAKAESDSARRQEPELEPAHA